MTPYLELITKKLSGEISQGEQESLQKWLDASPRNRLLYQRFEEVWSKARYAPVVRGQEETFNKIARRLALDTKEPIPISGNRSSDFWRSGRQIAATLLLVLSATLVITWNTRHQEADQPAETPPPVMITKSNPRGQKSLITLPDGSRVRLNAESSLEYSEDFARTREIKLVGEAFFDVVRDTLHPFVVTAGEIQVRVLGTSFDVQAFPFEEETMVAVASGAVTVEKKDHCKTSQINQLQAHEMVKVNHKTGESEKSEFNPDELLAWKEGVLLFQNAPFEEIVPTLERWYGVDFIIRRSRPITDGFTGRYDNPSLEVVLEGMSFASDFSFTIEGDQVIIE